MGQYYKPTFINDNGKPIAYIYPLNMDYGLKLMEHSYYGVLTHAIFGWLRNNPKSRLVWAGDYADVSCRCYERGAGWVDCNVYHKVTTLEEKNRIENIDTDSIPTNGLAYRAAWIINHTKRVAIPYFPDEYVEKAHSNANFMPINVLALLTCESNGRGGGDYYSNYNKDLVGSWCRDLLSVADSEADVPKGFRKDSVAFYE